MLLYVKDQLKESLLVESDYYYDIFRSCFDSDASRFFLYIGSKRYVIDVVKANKGKVISFSFGEDYFETVFLDRELVRTYNEARIVGHGWALFVGPKDEIIQYRLATSSDDIKFIKDSTKSYFSWEYETIYNALSLIKFIKSNIIKYKSFRKMNFHINVNLSNMKKHITQKYGEHLSDNLEMFEKG